MKTQIFSLVIATVLMVSCSSAPSSSSEENWTSVTGTGAPAFSSREGNEMNRVNNNESVVLSIEGNEWKLIEVYIDGRDTRFSRSTLPAEPGNFLTLNFDAQNISGVGVPNRYSAPYTIANNQISIMPMLSTMMASFFQPENITEHDFFFYLQNTHSWKLNNNTLELLSKAQNGSEVKLVFSL